ncbi:MAG TPA: 50S ribosomal protein L6 [Candidatus Eisenbacteria bacterium]|jgi:large subunit ribosomal protein L6|nr:50S ribosomal protein L6 [Candidatus Eisenbacteria bacterium]
MSRVGKKPLTIPSGVTVAVTEDSVAVKGPKGQLSLALLPSVKVSQEGNELTVSVKDPENVKHRALWGLFRRLIENMVVGVTKGYDIKLEINGIGFKASTQGKNLKLDVGFSHEVDFAIPEGTSVTVEKNVITVSGIDKQLVGETAAQIRRIKKPEPYKGKGIKYADEQVRRKAGKAAKTGSAA